MVCEETECAEFACNREVMFWKQSTVVLRVDRLLNQSDISNNEKTTETKQ
jgi:hypothetical protein